MKKLDRLEGTKALNEGFVMIFGEKHRELLETKGEELIELGLKNGKEWVNAKILNQSRISNYFEMYKEGFVKENDVAELEKCMQVYFTSDDINILKGKSKITDHDSSSVDEYVTLFVDKITESDVNIVSSKPFDHFKDYILNDKYKVTLYGEGGLQLDSYKKKNLKYYQEEGELFYMIEDIAKKYHYFGMLLEKEHQLELWIEKIRNNLTENTNYWLKTALSQIIYRLIKNEKYADEVIIDIQNYTRVIDGFLTHDQVTEKLSKIDLILPDNLFSEK